MSAGARTESHRTPALVAALVLSAVAIAAPGRASAQAPLSPDPAAGAPGALPGPPLFPPVPLAMPGAPVPDSGAQPSELSDQFRRKKRVIIAGATIFGLSYYASLVASSVGVSRNNQGSQEYIAGLVPIAGPFVTAVSRAVPNNSLDQGDFGGMALYLGLGLTQIVGTGLFIVGLRLPTGRPAPCRDLISAQLYAPSAAGIDTPPYRPCASISASFEPIVTPTFTGGGITGTF